MIYSYSWVDSEHIPENVQWTAQWNDSEHIPGKNGKHICQNIDSSLPLDNQKLNSSPFFKRYFSPLYKPQQSTLLECQQHLFLRSILRPYLRICFSGPGPRPTARASLPSSQSPSTGNLVFHSPTMWEQHYQSPFIHKGLRLQGVKWMLEMGPSQANSCTEIKFQGDVLFSVVAWKPGAVERADVEVQGPWVWPSNSQNFPVPQTSHLWRERSDQNKLTALFQLPIDGMSPAVSGSISQFVPNASL